MIVVERLAWMDQAACLNADPELFFSDDPQAVAAAKDICFGCPARGLCRPLADVDPRWVGTWAGEHRATGGRDNAAEARKAKTIAARRAEAAELLARGTKRCTRCTQVLPLEAFYRRNSAKDGRKNQCVSCCRKTDGKYAAAARLAEDETKSCTACGEVKPFDGFRVRKFSPAGRHAYSSRCKACLSQPKQVAA